jgi:hypothetical protein
MDIRQKGAAVGELSRLGYDLSQTSQIQFQKNSSTFPLTQAAGIGTWEMKTTRDWRIPNVLWDVNGLGTPA